MVFPKYTAPLFYVFFSLLFILFFAQLFQTCLADVGSAGLYNSPYIPTECYSEDATEFPSNNLFAAAGDGIWNNGAACGRQYVVRCISAPDPVTCADPDATIQVKIVDYANTAVSHPVVTSGTTLLLCNTAFATLVNGSSYSSTATTTSINIEFQQV